LGHRDVQVPMAAQFPVDKPHYQGDGFC